MNPKFKAGDIIKNFQDEHILVVSLLKYDRYHLYYMERPNTIRDLFMEVVEKECELVQRVET